MIIQYMVNHNRKEVVVRMLDILSRDICTRYKFMFFIFLGMK